MIPTQTPSRPLHLVSGLGLSARRRTVALNNSVWRWGHKELIDHIFVSHALVVVGKIAQDHVITDAAGPTPSIDDGPH